MGGLFELFGGEFSNIELHKDVCGKDISTFGVGGKLAVTAYPENEGEFISLVDFARLKNIDVVILGRCSDIIFSDGGFYGLAVKTDRMKKITVGKERIYCEAGVTVGQLLSACLKNDLGGLEFLAGIPASVGGAVKCNAGAFSLSVGDFIDNVTVYDGEIKKLAKKDCGFSYRKSLIIGGVLSAEFKLAFKSKAEQTEKMKDFLKRRSHQPKGRSCGSVFINPEGGFAGEMIEKCNLKGKRLGDIEISEKHANFLINRGNGSSKDAVLLIKEMQEKVYSKFGKKLMTEIKFIGENSNDFNG